MYFYQSFWVWRNFFQSNWPSWKCESHFRRSSYGWTPAYVCVLEIGRKKKEKKSKARVRASLDSHSTERSAEQTWHQQGGWFQQRELVIWLQHPSRMLRRELFAFFFTLHSLTILTFPQSPAASICRMMIYFNSAFINSFSNLVKSNYLAATQNVNVQHQQWS